MCFLIGVVGTSGLEGYQRISSVYLRTNLVGTLNDDLDNRVLLHPNCHQQVHSPDYNGPSLRPSPGV